jgi:demethylmenaquinone methyltransferase/2-methoxy-6-polyprenyl-1,4-benzoquinol methylase
MDGANLLPDAQAKPLYVNRMFARIAPTYDVVNRLMTVGQDQRWRRKLLDLCALPPQGWLLDIGAGTGDIAYMARTRLPGARAFAADFTYEMMAVGKAQPARRTLPFIQADAFALPFADNTFDAVASGFLMRNVVNRQAAFHEQVRVTKPGGRVLCLETTPPHNALLGPLFKVYFFRLVPLLGGLISGDRQAYTYLPHSTVDFPSPRELQRLMEQAGLRYVFYNEMMFGAVAIHVGTKQIDTA